MTPPTSLTPPTESEIAEGIMAETNGIFKKQLCCIVVERRVAAAKAVRKATIEALVDFPEFRV